MAVSFPRGAFALLLLVSIPGGCRGSLDVRFDRDTCYLDGHPAQLPEVEAREAEVGRAIARHQPWLVAITVVVVSLAGISYVERLMLLFSARKDTQGMGDRFRALVTRYRAHPVRYFSLVVGSVGLLLTAGVFYVYLDSDKRASERALGTLQFCHLALRTADERGALDEQRRNLTALHETAGEIRDVMRKLPPAEQHKAQEIVRHMDDAVGRESKLITQHLQRSEDTALAIRVGTESIERDLAGLRNDVSGLKQLPTNVRGVSDGLQRMESRLQEARDACAGIGKGVGDLRVTLDQLVSRPPQVCPACVCREAPRVVAELGAAVLPAPSRVSVPGSQTGASQRPSLEAEDVRRPVAGSVAAVKSAKPAPGGGESAQ